MYSPESSTSARTTVPRAPSCGGPTAPRPAPFVADLNPGPGSSNPFPRLITLGRVFVTANDGLHGNELMEVRNTPFGIPNDLDGDGRPDYSVFRPNDTTWSETGVPAGLPRWYTLLNQGNGTAGLYSWAVQWGLNGDIPVPADYNGDGKTDFTVFRPVDPTRGNQPSWYIATNLGPRKEDIGLDGNAFGFVAGFQANDIPVPGDFNGDGKADLAAYRPSTGTFRVVANPLYTGGATVVLQNSLEIRPGVIGGTPFTADFDGDGRTDFAVYHGPTGGFVVRLNKADGSLPYVLQTAVGTGISFVNGDIPVASDVNGDGRSDWVLYRPNDGTPIDLNGDGKADDVNGDGIPDFQGKWYALLNQGVVATPTPPTASNNAVSLYANGLKLGITGDVPISGDFNGDTKSDWSVWRPYGRQIPFDFNRDGKNDVVAEYYTFLNSGPILNANNPQVTVYDWARGHGFLGDVAMGRNPLPGRADVVGIGGSAVALAAKTSQPAGGSVSTSAVATPSAAVPRRAAERPGRPGRDAGPRHGPAQPSGFAVPEVRPVLDPEQA